MTTTRINHTGHNHPSTTAARTECRKAMKATPIELFPTLTLGRSQTRHLAVVAHDGSLVGARCGAGLQRGRRSASEMFRDLELPFSGIECGRCSAFNGIRR